jgi:hypothetical protein
MAICPGTERVEILRLPVEVRRLRRTGFMISNSDNPLASEFPNALTRAQFYWKRSRSGTAADRSPDKAWAFTFRLSGHCLERQIIHRVLGTLKTKSNRAPAVFHRHEACEDLIDFSRLLQK